MQVIYNSKRLNRYKKRYYKKTQNLLTGKTEQSEEEQRKADLMNYEILNYWHPNLTISLVYDQTAWQKGLFYLIVPILWYLFLIVNETKRRK